MKNILIVVIVAMMPLALQSAAFASEDCIPEYKLPVGGDGNPTGFNLYGANKETELLADPSDPSGYFQVKGESPDGQSFLAFKTNMPNSSKWLYEYECYRILKKGDDGGLLRATRTADPSGLGDLVVLSDRTKAYVLGVTAGGDFLVDQYSYTNGKPSFKIVPQGTVVSKPLEGIPHYSQISCMRDSFSIGDAMSMYLTNEKNYTSFRGNNIPKSLKKCLKDGRFAACAEGDYRVSKERPLKITQEELDMCTYMYGKDAKECDPDDPELTYTDSKMFHGVLGYKKLTADELSKNFPNVNDACKAIAVCLSLAVGEQETKYFQTYQSVFCPGGSAGK